MLTFWGNIEETDISAYAATLILPSYMSHLQLSPFHFSTQQRANSGEPPLTLTYTGPGRVEQFELTAREHAILMLCHTCPGLQQNRIQLPKQGAIWFWPPSQQGQRPPQDLPVVIANDDLNDEEQNDCNEATAVMRLFFRPDIETLAASNPETAARSFSPEKAYLSISRKEIFLHIDVIAAYLRAWLEYLGLQEEPENITCRTTACGFMAESPYITVEVTLTPNDVFQDILQFAGLSQWFAQLGGIAPDLDAEGTILNERGLLIPLKNV